MGPPYVVGGGDLLDGIAYSSTIADLNVRLHPPYLWLASIAQFGSVSDPPGIADGFAHATPEIHHSDQGGQYAATAYVDLLTDSIQLISMAQVGEAWQNGYAERVIRTIKEEESNLSNYQDFHDAYQQIGRFLTDVYNRKRIHSSLGYLIPTEFEASLPQQPSAIAAIVP